VIPDVVVDQQDQRDRRANNIRLAIAIGTIALIFFLASFWLLR